MGINHEIYSKRTLSHCGEKEKLMSVNSEFKCTHSHTVMPEITLDGKQYGKLFINFMHIEIGEVTFEIFLHFFALIFSNHNIDLTFETPPTGS